MMEPFQPTRRVITVELEDGVTITFEKQLRVERLDLAHSIGYAFERDVLRAWNNTSDANITTVWPVTKVREVREAFVNDDAITGGPAQTSSA